MTVAGGTFSTSVTGDSKVYIVKLSADGNFVWGHLYGGDDLKETMVDLNGHSVAIDSNDNIYVVGYFTSTSLDFGSNVVLSNPSNAVTAYIVKLSPAGVVSGVPMNCRHLMT